ncbi:hypothetical protein [Symbiobacterium terraclitae]|uniref:hypothetical protein n=1 Tax=Symbiobacterium terraclitae TaxID=557451 RepID=UPI0035B5097C
MLVHALLSRSTADAVAAIADTHTIAQVSVRDRDHTATVAELNALSQLTPHVLLVAIDAGPPDALITGLRQYRVRQPSVRIILLAPGRTPGDPLISTLVGLSIYDILTDDGPALPAAVRTALEQTPASYAHAARWHNPGLSEQDAAVDRGAQPAPALIRVMAARDRPLLIAVAGATHSAGVTSLSLALGEELAHRGLSVTLLADMPPSETALLAASQPHGLSLDLRSLRQDGNQEPLLLAFEPPARSDVVIMDLGYLRHAAESDPQTLTVADHLLILWPYPRHRFLTITSSLLALTGATEQLNRIVRQALTRAVHIAYLCPTAQTSAACHLVQSTLQELLPPGTGSRDIIPVPLGPTALNLDSLLAHLAPPVRDRRGRLVPLRGPSLVTAMREAAGLIAAISTPAAPLPGLRLLSWIPILWLLWLGSGLLHLAGVPVPSWLYPDLPASLWRFLVH